MRKNHGEAFASFLVMKQLSRYGLLLSLALSFTSCHTQTKKPEPMNKSAEWMCDLQTGTCAPNAETVIEEIVLTQPAKVKMLYFTDPICSACWAIEPELRKFKLAYGHFVDIEYKMGGLLPKWEGFADRANGIAGPSDVAGHWDEVGAATGMSIDGDVWLEDPLYSSFPPSIAFKAMEMQGDSLALAFLRKIREMVFLQKKNITKTAHLTEVVGLVGGDIEQFLVDYEKSTTEVAFKEDINLSRQMGVRGFPSFVMIGEDGKAFRLSGMAGYDQYVLALEKALGQEVQAKTISNSAIYHLKKYKYLSTREISVLVNREESELGLELEQLAKNGEILKEPQKFGNFWRVVGK